MKKLLLVLLGFSTLFSQEKKSSYENLDVFGDFLVWYASQETDSIWTSVISDKITSSGFVDTFTAPSLQFDWNYGFRAGFGYDLPTDCWDTTIYWSWFQTDGRDSTAGGIIVPEFFGAFINGDLADAGKVHWKLRYNMCDWELGRKFCVSEALALRPFIGLKGGWIDQKIDSKWNVTAQSIPGMILPVAVNYTATEKVTNNFWGIGPSFGFNTTWDLSSFFHILGDFSSATMWGSWGSKDKYTNTSDQTNKLHMNDLSLGALMLRGFFGFGWNAPLNCHGSQISMKMGYEGQLWLNHLRIPTFQQLRLHGDLTLQGGTINCRVDF